MDPEIKHSIRLIGISFFSRSRSPKKSPFVSLGSRQFLLERFGCKA